MSAITDTPVRRTQGRLRRSGAAEAPLHGGLHYFAHTVRLTFGNIAYLIFTIGLPVTMYLVFNSIFGSEQVVPGVNYSALIMVQMAGYGALGSAMSGGAVIALERRSGWFRQLMITAVPERSFLAARAAAVLVVVLPSLLLVFLAGFVVGGVRAPAEVWIASLLAMWASLLPLAVLGLVLGLLVKGEAVQGLNSVVMMVLSMAGGLWFPIQMMPAPVQAAATWLPSYWVGEFGRWPFLGGDFPWQGVAVQLGWTAVLIVIGTLGYRRAVRNSKR